jgi:hypothetical protein
MPLIDTTTLLKVADRAAYQYGQLQDTCTAIQAEGNGYYFDIVSATEDPDVEIPCDSEYYDVDEDFNVGFMVAYGTRLSNILGAMEAHFSRDNGSGLPLQVGGWDGYLTAKNKRVSYYFAQLFFATHGFYMLANDVFSESVDQFARLQVTTGPVLTYTDGVNYGTGAAANPANGTFYAATQLKVVVTTMGATQLDVRLSVKDLNNNLATIDVTIPGGSLPGAEIPIGTTTDRFLDVTAAIFKPAGSTGTVGDDINVMNLKERQIAL